VKKKPTFQTLSLSLSAGYYYDWADLLCSWQ